MLFPLSQARLGELLWHAARVLKMSSPSAIYPSRKSPSPSAGGLQSQNILVQPSPESLHFYDPLGHSFGKIVQDSKIGPLLFKGAMTVVPAPKATILWPEISRWYRIFKSMRRVCYGAIPEVSLR